jgi:hypothetical protein
MPKDYPQTLLIYVLVDMKSGAFMDVSTRKNDLITDLHACKPDDWEIREFKALLPFQYEDRPCYTVVASGRSMPKEYDRRIIEDAAFAAKTAPLRRQLSAVEFERDHYKARAQQLEIDMVAEKMRKPPPFMVVPDYSPSANITIDNLRKEVADRDKRISKQAYEIASLKQTLVKAAEAMAQNEDAYDRRIKEKNVQIDKFMVKNAELKQALREVPNGRVSSYTYNFAVRESLERDIDNLKKELIASNAAWATRLKEAQGQRLKEHLDRIKDLEQERNHLLELATKAEVNAQTLTILQGRINRRDEYIRDVDKKVGAIKEILRDI